ncbi:MAG: hypothetical protein EBW44_14755 [Rhodobacteraceae bacterium]|nr:hypothetical protein [Paracoccaceae bacterium]
MRILALILCMIPLFASGEEIVLGMSQDEVAITATFDGSNILVFGAIKRESAIPEGELGVIVTIAGPSEPVAVHRKERRFDRILKDTEDLRHQISIERAIRSVGAPMTITDAPAFTDAVVRIRKSQDLYKRSENSVLVDQETLFRTSVDMPANLTEGDYFTRIFLTRDGQVVSEFETTIDVKKVGLERFLYNLSRQQPLIYGLLSLAIAILAGWLASSFFRMIRGT